MGKHYGEQIILDVLQMKQSGHTHRVIGEKHDLSTNQIKKLVERYNRKQRMIQAGVVLKKRGRTPTNSNVTNADKISVLKYELNRKDYEINRLKMQNELLKDFLKEIGRG